jgi:hypothetical protein
MTDCDIGSAQRSCGRNRFQPLSMCSFEPIGCRLLRLGAGMKRREFITLLGGAFLARRFTGKEAVETDLILMAPPDEQSMLMADILANLGSFLLEKKEESDPTKPRHSRH